MHWCTRVGRRCTLPSSCRTACHRPRSKCSIPAMPRCRLPFRRGSPTGLHLSFRRQWSHHFRRSFRRQWFHHFHLSFRLHPWFRRYWRRDVWARGLGGALRDPADEASGSRYLLARLSLRAIPRSQLQRKALTPKDACCSAWKLTSARLVPDRAKPQALHQVSIAPLRGAKRKLTRRRYQPSVPPAMLRECER
jgi:hypothetical protein